MPSLDQFLELVEFYVLDAPTPERGAKPEGTSGRRGSRR